MTLEEINNELKKIEINDLYSAIKGHVLEDMKVALEDTNKDKLEFYDNKNFDEIILDLEDQIDELICNYYIYNIDSYLDEDICL